jgi:hypothetical protein
MLKKVVRLLVFSSLFCFLKKATAQDFQLHFQPVFSKKNIVLDAPFFDQKGDSLAFHTLRFYVGNLVFLKKGQVVFEEKKYHLLDLEDEKSLDLAFDFPEKMTFDSLQFDLGVDSLTHVSGAMGGDLDPTRGMFWTWQSGYINLKLEGFHSKCTAQKHEFEFHLGGFLSPFPTVQKVVLPVFSIEKIWVNFDLAPFFEKINWAKNPNVMSPCSEAVRFSELLSKSFFVHEK